MTLVAVLAPWLAPYNPDAINLENARLFPPVFLSDGTWQHILGTDNTGRDVLSRLIYGAHVS